MAAVDDLTWADANPGQEPTLGWIFCLTFIRGVDEAEALRRMGALPDTVATRTRSDVGDLHTYDDGYPHMASALSLGTWTVVFEPSGFDGSLLTATVSRGTEAVSVLRHDYACPEFAYTVDGEMITQFDPTFPVDRYGTDPDRLLDRMHELGFTTTEDEDDNFDGAIGRSLRLVEHLTGDLPTFAALTGPLTSAHIERWFTDAPKEPARRPDHDGPVDAITEVRRLTSLYGLTDTPGLAGALTAAERGERVTVTPDSPLGRHVRTWLTVSRRAGWSLNDHNSRDRMTETERRHAADLGWLVRALGAALQPPPTPAD
jgi:hypothetical protein